MQDNFKQIPWLVLAVGVVVYAFCVVNNTDVETYTGLTLMITLGAWACLNIAMDSFNSVSYTHLTLPTICSV